VKKSLKISSSDENIIDSTSASFTGVSPNCLVALKPKPNANGSVEVKVLLFYEGEEEVKTEKVFKLNISPVNDVPAITLVKNGPVSEVSGEAVFEVDYEEVKSISLASTDVLITNASCQGVSVVEVSETKRKITLTKCSGDSSNATIALKEGTALDKAVNSAPKSAESKPFIVDNTSPSPSLTADDTSNTYRNPLTVKVDFGEAVTGFELSDVSVSGGSLGNLNDIGDGEYTFDWSFSGYGSYTLDIAAEAVTDQAGKKSTAATQFSMSYDNFYYATTFKFEYERINLQKGAAAKH